MPDLLFNDMMRGTLKGIADKTQYDDILKILHGSWYAFKTGEEYNLLEMTAEEVAATLVNLADTINNPRTEIPYTYVNSRENPALIKTYDPAKCKGACSTSAPPPWWVFSKAKPEEKDLEPFFPTKKTYFQKMTSIAGKWKS